MNAWVWPQRTEAKAGALVALGGFAQALVYGLLAFSPLGVQGLAYGVYAGLASAVLGGLVGALWGRAPVQFGGPRSATALVLAGSLHVVLPLVQHAQVAVLLLSLEVVLAGLLVAWAQRRGLGQIMQYLPAPVLIGMSTTLGVFSAYKLLPAMLGFAVYTTLPQALQNWDGFSPWVTLVSALTVLVLLYFRLIRPNPLGLMYGLLCGLALHGVCVLLWPLLVQSLQFTGPVPVHGLGVGPSHPLLVGPGLGWVMQMAWSTVLDEPMILLHLLVGASVLALLIVLESMQALLHVDQTLGHRHNTNQELKAVALGNVLCGLACALPTSYYLSRTSAALGVGSVSRQSEWVYTTCMVLLVICLWAWIPILPMHVLAAGVALSSLFLIQGRTLRWFWASLQPRLQRQLGGHERFTVLVVLGMLAATALSNLLVGTLTGVVFVAAYFLRQQSSGGLQSIEINPMVRSRTMRSRLQRQCIDAGFEHIHWVRLDGNLFFGNASAIAIRLEDALHNTQGLVLDCSQVRSMDDTAAHYLHSILSRRLRHAVPTTVVVLPVHLHDDDLGFALFQRDLASLGISVVAHVDDALFSIEHTLLTRANLLPVPDMTEQIHDSCEMSLQGRIELLMESHLCDGLPIEEVRHLARALECRNVRPGQVLFQEGQPASALYIVALGQLSAWHTMGSRSERLMRFCAGSLVGEMALVDHKPRSATVVADIPSQVLCLHAHSFHELPLQLSHPMMCNLAKEMALRMRLTNNTLVLQVN